MMTEIIALTGGIACGKSSASAIFAKLGRSIVDADDVARQIVKPNSDALNEIVSTFGRSILLESGELDRKALGSIVFSDEDARQKLNAITHPRIAMQTLAQFQALQDPNAPYLIYDAALLIESGRHRDFHRLIVVRANHETQRTRLMQRDDISMAEAEKKIASQMPVEEKAKLADWVIDNDGTLDALERRIHEIDREILKSLPKK